MSEDPEKWDNPEIMRAQIVDLRGLLARRDAVIDHLRVQLSERNEQVAKLALCGEDLKDLVRKLRTDALHTADYLRDFIDK